MGLRTGGHGKQAPLHLRDGAVQFPLPFLLLGALLAEPVRQLPGGTEFPVQLAQAFLQGLQPLLELVILIQEQIDLDLP